MATELIEAGESEAFARYSPQMLYDLLEKLEASMVALEARLGELRAVWCLACARARAWRVTRRHTQAPHVRAQLEEQKDALRRQFADVAGDVKAFSETKSVAVVSARARAPARRGDPLAAVRGSQGALAGSLDEQMAALLQMRAEVADRAGVLDQLETMAAQLVAKGAVGNPCVRARPRICARPVPTARSTSAYLDVSAQVHVGDGVQPARRLVRARGGV